MTLAEMMTFFSRRLTICIGLAVCASFAASCSPTVEHRGYVAKPGAFEQISNGMSKLEVESILGSPSTTASVNYQGDSYYYITSVTEQQSFLGEKELSREVIAIRFDRNEAVQNFAQYGLEDGRIIDVNTRKSPVTGQETGILADIFAGLRRPNAPASTNNLQRKF